MLFRSKVPHNIGRVGFRTSCPPCEVTAFHRDCDVRGILQSEACRHPIAEGDCGMPALHGWAYKALPGSQCIEVSRGEQSTAARSLFQRAMLRHVHLRKWPRDTPYPDALLKFVRASCDYVLPSISPGQQCAPCDHMFGRSTARGLPERCNFQEIGRAHV